MLRGSLLLLLQQVGQAAGQLIAVLVLARALHPAGRGGIAFVTASTMLVGTVVGLGLAAGLTVLAAQRPAERAGLLGTGVAVTTTVSTLAALGFCVVLATVPGSHPESVHGWTIAAVGGGIVGWAVSGSAGGFLLGCRRFVPYTAAWIATPFAYTAVVVALATLGRLTVVSAALAWSITRLLGALALVVAALSTAGVARPSRRLLTDTVRFGLRGWLGAIADRTNARADQWLMGLISPAAAVGVYAVAVNAGEVLLYLPTAVAAALAPHAAALEPEAQSEAAARAFRAVALATALLCVPAALVGPVLLPFAFGHAYAASVVPFVLLLPGAVGWCAMAVFQRALYAAGAPGAAAVGSVAALATGLTLDLALIAPFDARGAAAAASAASLVGGAVMLARYRRQRTLPLSWLVPSRSDARVLASPFRRALHGS